MEFAAAIRESRRLLSALEDGNVPLAYAYQIAGRQDPLVTYFILKFVRSKYPATHPQATGVLQRVGEFFNTYPDLVSKNKSCESDPLNEWFEDDFSIKEHFEKQDEFITQIVEKIEG